MKKVMKLSKERQVGIYERCEIEAKIYPDKILLSLPYIAWQGQTGSLDYRRCSIRDQAVLARVRQELADECEDSAWAVIEQAADKERKP